MALLSAITHGTGNLLFNSCICSRDFRSQGYTPYDRPRPVMLTLQPGFPCHNIYVWNTHSSAQKLTLGCILFLIHALDLSLFHVCAFLTPVSLPQTGYACLTLPGNGNQGLFRPDSVCRGAPAGVLHKGSVAVSFRMRQSRISGAISFHIQIYPHISCAGFTR